MGRMPVIELDFQKLKESLGFDISRDEFLEMIPSIGADVERASGDELAIEFFPDRPDLYSVEGIARAFRALYGVRKSGMGTPAGGAAGAMPLPEYTVHPSDITLTVDPNLLNIRPYIGCAVIKGLEFDERDIQGLMSFQEKLHLTIGRKRKKVAIGIHDLDAITPPFRYYGADPDGCSFIPLAKEEEEMTLREILEKHEKGVAYKHILEDKPLYPVIEDRSGYILSFPPIINGRQTTVTTDTKNIFLDLTGTHEETVMNVLSIVATSFAEMGGEIHGVCLHDVRGRKKLIPDLGHRTMKFGIKYINTMLGRTLTPEEVVRYLNGMGFCVQRQGSRKNTFLVSIPAYRIDILHKIDIIEDVAISCGYMNFAGSRPGTMTYGRKLHPGLEKLRDYMSGIGFSEVMTLMLTSEDEQYLSMNHPEPDDAIKLKNPITRDHTTLRTWLAPGLLSILRNNKHRDLPQRLYELDYVFKGKAAQLKLEALEMSTTTGFSDSKTYMKSLLKVMGEPFLKDFDVEFEPTGHPSFIPGRVGETVLIEKEKGTRHHFGIFGELHPEVISNFSLENPVSHVGINLHFLVERGLFD